MVCALRFVELASLYILSPSVAKGQLEVVFNQLGILSLELSSWSLFVLHTPHTTATAVSSLQSLVEQLLIAVVATFTFWGSCMYCLLFYSAAATG